MKKIKPLLLLVISAFTYAQPNCFIYPEDSGERKACELSYKAIEYQQGSEASQKLFDEAIAIGPKFAWAYYEKSVPYFKRGFLHKGLQILNKAIELEPREYLCYRAYWYWQYKNYQLCIQDLEQYYNLPKIYPQLTPGGDKDMRIILGLCYWKNGNTKKGIQTILDCINSYESEDDIGYTDYQTLGMLYVLNQQYENAIEALNRQLKINKDIADTYYFLGLAYKEISNNTEALMQFEKALNKFNEPNRFRNINAGFQVELADIKQELEALKAE